MKRMLLLAGLAVLCLLQTAPLQAAAERAGQVENFGENISAGENGRYFRKAEKRLGRLQQKMERQKGKLDGRFNLGGIGLIVLLLGGLFMLLGLAIPYIGVLFLVIGIIVGFVGLLLTLLLGGLSVDVGESSRES